MRRTVLACALIASTAACSTMEPAEAPPIEPTFTYAPPALLQYVRTEKRVVEIAAVGTPAQSIDDEELRWVVDAHRLNTSTIVEQTLAHVTWKHDGETIVDGAPAVPVTAQLVLDTSGRLTDVRGLEGSSEAIAKLAPPEVARLVGAIFSPQNLRATIELRHEELAGAVAGHPARVGASYRIDAPKNEIVRRRDVDIDREEPCDHTTCMLVHVRAQMNPKVLSAAAEVMVRAYAYSRGAGVTGLKVRSAEAFTDGLMRVEPSTMIVHGATFGETGRAVIGGLREPVVVDMRGRTTYAFEYGPHAAVAAR
jgi:hypothetical protein